MFNWHWCLLLICLTVPVHSQDRNPSGYEPSLDRVQGRHERLPKLIEVARLFPSDASEGLGNGFGSAAAIEGRWIAVGASGDSQVESQSGAVYIFRRDETGWIEHSKLVPDDGAWRTHFGGSVAMDGDRIVVGASAAGSSELGPRVGYIFRRDDNSTPHQLVDDVWIEETKLVVPQIPYCCDLGPSGHEVSISGQRVAVGHIAGFWGIGAVSIFEYELGEWRYDGQLFGSKSGDLFGNPIVLNSNRIFVGAPYADGDSSQTGAVYVFRKDLPGWTQEAKLSSSDGATGDRFGVSLSVNRGLLAVGAQAKPTGFGYGHVYVFERVGRNWMQQAHIHPVNPPTEKAFGSIVSLDRDVLVVSSYDQIRAIPLLYTFSRIGDEWILNQRLEPVDAFPGGGYYGVQDWSGRYLLVGGPGLVYILQVQR